MLLEFQKKDSTGREIGKPNDDLLDLHLYIQLLVVCSPSGNILEHVAI